MEINYHRDLRKRYTYFILPVAFFLDMLTVGEVRCVTLKEIAKRAEVSVSTVSRILNSPDDSFASKKVRDKVWAAVRETGYVPNQSARNLRRNTSVAAVGVIAVVREDCPLCVQLAQAVEFHLLEQGFAVLPEGQKESEADGVIVIGKVNATHKNMVYVGVDFCSPETDQIVSGGEIGATDALNHLVAYGHQEIAFIGETKNSAIYDAYAAGLEKNGFPIKRAWIAKNITYFLRNAGTNLPTALFCANDTLAVEAMKILKEEKIKVPYPISVIGMGNIKASGYTTPMLTTVGLPILEMGAVSVQVLISRIRKKHSLPLKITLPHKLILRDSVSNLHGGICI